MACGLEDIAAMSTPEVTRCLFCEGKCSLRYRMGDFEIWRCHRCGTGRAWPTPTPETLAKFYDGFLTNLKADALPHFLAAAKALYGELGFRAGGGMRMLDVGGGGGFFAKAFEELGYGDSTYVDLDPKSTAFAREELGLRRTFNADVAALPATLERNFDFIYCRHVIEHLPDPVGFMFSLLGLLKQDGLFVVQCPNGSSIEYLAYPWSKVMDRFSRIRRDNGISRFKLAAAILGGGMLHGMDPPRHLWAVTKRGMKAWARRMKLQCHVSMRHLGDSAFSPHYRPKATFRGRLSDFAGQRLLAPVYGGTHLIAKLRKLENDR
jgi:SAM-dependent methyltransferase